MAMYQFNTQERVILGCMAGISMTVGLNIVIERNIMLLIPEMLLLLLGMFTMYSAFKGEMIWWCEREKKEDV